MSNLTTYKDCRHLATYTSVLNQDGAQIICEIYCDLCHRHVEYKSEVYVEFPLIRAERKSHGLYGRGLKSIYDQVFIRHLSIKILKINESSGSSKIVLQDRLNFEHLNWKE